MSNSRPNRPGKPVPHSGQYERISRSGNGTGGEYTLVKGEPFPPTPSSCQSYRLVDKTKHRKG